MKKITFALALGAGLVLSLAGPSARADAMMSSTSAPIVQSLPPMNLPASTFSTDFTPVTAVASGTYSFYNTSNAGVVESQVFAGSGSFTGLYAYAYQFGVNPVNDNSTNQPTSVNSASMLFNATPT
ncbi:MAG TPA: hypothetical protein VKA15_23215, partial [Isosphaeraceae bacterium]|nr:hypothetical protein [Isosphaeraceae bacterium]